MSGVKHLPGQHDQLSHGREGDGSDEAPDKRSFMEYLAANNYVMYHATSAAQANQILKDGLLSDEDRGVDPVSEEDLDEFIDENGPYAYDGVFVGSVERAEIFGDTLLAINLRGMEDRLGEFSGLGEYASAEDTQAIITGSIPADRISIVKRDTVPETQLPGERSAPGAVEESSPVTGGPPQELWDALDAATEAGNSAERERLLREIWSYSSAKHLPGQHDQLDHAGGRGGSDSDLSQADYRKVLYGKHAGTPEDPVPCGGDIKRAAQIIADGGNVQLSQPDEVATLLAELRDIVKEAEAKGEKAPNYDLCRVSVPGTNLFCQDEVTRPDGSTIDRIQMPQLSTKDPVPGSPADAMPRNAKGEVDLSGQFGEFLASSGRTPKRTTIDASHLRASQSELNGAKVAGIAGAVAAGKIDVNDPNGAIYVTEDNYVVDGHHRWAAYVAESYRTGKPLEMPVIVVPTDIGTALTLANFWTDEMGIPPADAKQTKKSIAELYAIAVEVPELLDVVRKMAEDPAPKHLPGEHDQLDHGHRDGGGSPLRLRYPGPS